MEKPSFLNTRITSENAYLRTIQRDFVDSQGREGNVITMESVRGSGGTFVFALTEDRKVILNREYKFGPDDFFYTLPSGWMEDENPAGNAMKELREESGYTSNEIPVYLGRTMISGYIAGYNSLYILKNCYKEQEATPHEGEEIENHLIPLEVFEQMIVSGDILDSHTISCYFLAKEKTQNFTNL